jgi:hypothetical protein
MLQKESSEVTVTDLVGKELFQGEKPEFIRAVRHAELFDTVDWAEVAFNGETSRFSPYSLPLGTIGVITIVIDPADESKAFSSLIEKEFEISFESRSILWRYNVIPRRESNLSNFKIMNGKNKNLFKELGETVLTNGKKAHLIQSELPIKLKKNYD